MRGHARRGGRGKKTSDARPARRLWYACAAGLTTVLVAVPLWIALAPPEWSDEAPQSAAHVSAARLTAEVSCPEPLQWSIVNEAAHPAIDRTLRRCRRDPSADSLALLGRVYHGNGVTGLAAESYELALEMGDDSASTPYLLALILYEEGRIDEAAAWLRESIVRESRYPLAHHHLGRAQLESGDLDGAIDSFARAIALDRNDPILHTGLAKALRLAERLEEAEAALRAALDLDPAHPAAHQLLGLVLHALDRPEEAELHLANLQHYDSTVYDDPWIWEAYQHAASLEVRLDQARHLLRFGHLESALTLLTELAGRYRDSAATFRLLGYALVQAGEHQRGLDAYAAAARLDPSDATSRLSMAHILLDYNMFDEADRQAKLALDIDPRLFGALVVRGVAALRTGRLAEAREQLGEIHRKRPTDIHVAAHLAEALVALDEPEGAIEVLAAVLPHSSGTIVAFAEYQLAAALVRLERFAEAEDALRRAQSSDPGNERIMRKMAEVVQRREQ